MGRINLFGLVLVALGGILIFLGVTGRYQVFTGVPGGPSTQGSVGSESGPTGVSTSGQEQALAQGIATGVTTSTDTPGFNNAAFQAGIQSILHQYAP